MPKYSISVSNAAGSTSAKKTLIGVDCNQTGENAEIIECIMTGSGASAAQDYQHQAGGYMCTMAATGTSTAVVAEPFNQAAPASALLAGVNYSAEPTAYSAVASVLFGFNQRGGMRWAVPQGEGIKLQNQTEDSGFGWTELAGATAGNLDAIIHYWENN